MDDKPFLNQTFIGIEFNHWKLHNINLIEILAKQSLGNSKARYLNLSTKLYPNFGTLFRGNSPRLSFIGTSVDYLEKQCELNLSVETRFKWLSVTKRERLKVAKLIYQSTFESLMELSIEGVNFGKSIFSTIYSDLKTSKPNEFLFRSEFYRLALIWLRIHKSIDAFFIENKFDTLIIFNGRFYGENAAIEAALKHNMKVLYHESSGRNLSYTVEGFSPFSIEMTAIAVQNFSKGKPLQTIISIGTKWFSDRINLNSPELKRFQRNWTGESVNLRKDTKIAVFFSTSDDEFLGLGSEWNFGQFKTQHEAAEDILRLLRELGYFTVVRVHPNTQHKSTEMNRQWDTLRNVDRIIRSNAKINSYGLIKQADLVVVAGSTIGIESIFLNKVTASVGSSIYEKAGIFVNLKNCITAEEVAERLSRFKPENAKIEALKFAYWEHSRIKYREFLTPLKSEEFTDEYSFSNFETARIRLARKLQKKIIVIYGVIDYQLAQLLIRLKTK